MSVYAAARDALDEAMRGEPYPVMLAVVGESRHGVAHVVPLPHLERERWPFVRAGAQGARSLCGVFFEAGTVMVEPQAWSSCQRCARSLAAGTYNLVSGWDAERQR